MLAENRHAYIISVIFVGEFNPVIVQPFWLASKGLIKEEEAESANVEVIHNELVRYSLEWASIQITRNRFEIRSTQQAYFEPLKDLAASVFEVLRETPLRAVGINHIRHYTISEKQYRDLGDTLAPFKNWKGALEDPQLLKVEMLQKNSDGTSYRIRIQPSDYLKAPFSFMINLNDHTPAVPTAGRISPAMQIVAAFKTRWRSSSLYADQVEDTIEKLIKS